MMTNPNPSYDPVSVHYFLEQECRKHGPWVRVEPNARECREPGLLERIGLNLTICPWIRSKVTRTAYKDWGLSVDKAATQD